MNGVIVVSAITGAGAVNTMPSRLMVVPWGIDPMRDDARRLGRISGVGNVDPNAGLEMLSDTAGAIRHLLQISDATEQDVLLQRPSVGDADVLSAACNVREIEAFLRQVEFEEEIFRCRSHCRNWVSRSG